MPRKKAASSQKTPKEPNGIACQPLSLDDLEVGDWIVVTDRKPMPTINRDAVGETVMMVPIPINIERYEASGTPLLVRSVSLPFVLVSPIISPYQLASVNVSIYEIRRPTQQYVRAYTAALKDWQNSQGKMPHPFIQD